MATLYAKLYMIGVGSQQPKNMDIVCKAKKGKKRTKRTTGWSVSPHSLDRTGNVFPGVHFQEHEGQEGNKKQSTQTACLIELIAFCDKMTCSVDEERKVDAIYFDLLRLLTLCPPSYSFGS